MDELFNSCPPMNFTALEEKVLAEALPSDNYLFYRTYHDFTGWLDADAGTAWELHCTACHQRVAADKRKVKPSRITCCPECGAVVQPRKWIENRRDLRTRILWYEFQRGEGRRVWLHAYAVTHDFCPAPGDERLEFEERARYLFDDGAACRWTFEPRCGEWVKRTRVTKTVWHQNVMSCMPPYPAYIGSIDPATIDGSCLEYSQVDQAIHAGFDIPEYIDFYLRNPMVEYLWKFGLSGLLWDGLMHGQRQELRRVVNLRAKRPKDLLPGLTVPEVRRIAADPLYCSLRFVGLYRKCRADGTVDGDYAGFAWACVVSECPCAVRRAEEHGIKGRTLRSYIERQARRSKRSVMSMMRDYDDYLRQLDELGAGELAPADLVTAHERLSARLRKFIDLTLNQKFRFRRRLYRWLRWRCGGMLIRPVDSVQEITAEGERQCNCVAGYARRHADGETIICVLRRADAPGTSWHTVELDPQTLTVRQCRGYRNQAAGPEAEAFVSAWTERLKNIRFGRKTA